MKTIEETPREASAERAVSLLRHYLTVAADGKSDFIYGDSDAAVELRNLVDHIIDAAVAELRPLIDQAVTHAVGELPVHPHR